LVASLTLAEKATVVRVRGQVSVQPQAVTADLNIVGAIGMGVVTEEAFNAGITAIPEPFSDADWGGWLMWRSFSYALEVVSEIGTYFPDWDFEVDSKAMRKVDINEVVVIVAESQGGAFSVSTLLRTLIKLT